MSTRLSAADRRKEILKAATMVFARANYRGAGVAAIAESAGVSEALLYKHFASKKAMFCEILERTGVRIVEVWEKAVAEEPDALSALRHAGDIYLENLHSHPDEAILQFQALAETADPDIAAVLRSNHLGYIGFFEALIARGQSDGTIRTDVDPHVAAVILNGSGLTFTLSQVLNLDPDEEGAQPMIRTQLDWLAQPMSGGRQQP